MEYIKVSQAAEKWGISSRRVRRLCAEGKIEGVIRKGKLYMLPENAVKPKDGRVSKKSILTEAKRKKKLYSSMRSLTREEKERLIGDFAVEYTYNSNAIEGNKLTLQETAEVLQGVKSDQKPLKDQLEAVGHRDAFRYVCDMANADTPLDEEIIKTVHSFVLMCQPEDKGEYRRVSVRILGAYKLPAQPYAIEAKMHRLLCENAERKKTMSDIERIALFHLEFEGIHPFIDGNGRTGRLIMNLELIRRGYPAINISCADRKRYCNAFDSFYRDGDHMPMAEIIAEYICKSCDDLFRILGKS